MLTNYLKIAYRNLLKNKIFSIINMVGLAIGMAACLLIFQYVSFEWSYDQFHEKSQRIYRLSMDQYKQGALETQSATIFPVVGRTFQESFPESVEAFVRLTRQKGVFSYTDGNQEQVFDEKGLFYADHTFFDVFSFPLLMGSAAQALKEPNMVVITAAMAEKYFGNSWQVENPVGKTIHFKSYFGETEMLITGVVADPPENSHLKFDFLASYSTIYTWDDGDTDYRDESENAWFWEEFYTYVLLKPGANPQQLEKAFEPIVDERTADRREMGFLYRFHLQPVDQIHLHSKLMNELEANGDAQQVYILLIIGICMLAIAWVNFVNLSTVKSIERAQEVGMRKVLGATRKQLIGQHLLEASLLNIGGLLLAFTILQFSLPFFIQLTGINPENIQFLQSSRIFYFGLFLLAGIIASGLYPAFVLSAYQPVKVLKGKLSHSRQGGMLKKGLIVFQFSMAALAIMVIFTIHRQLDFMKNHELGVDIHQKLVIEGSKFVDSVDHYRDNMYAYKTSLKQHSMVQGVTLSRNVPATEIRGNNYVKTLDKPDEPKFCHVMGVDYDYMATFGLQLLAGRFFDESQPISSPKMMEANKNAPDFGTNDHSIMINETAAKLLGFQKIEDALHQQIRVFGGIKEIIGVVKDYHHKSLKNQFEPIMFYLQPIGWDYITLDIKQSKDHTEKLTDVIAFAEREWKQIYPDEPFSYFFLDDFFNQQYKADQQFYTLFNIFTGLIIFIACLGLFGLSAYTTLQRTKEIGIRKVLGASVHSIVGLLSKDIVRLVIIASLLALPIAYFGMQRWLTDYAFHISLKWWAFCLPVALVFAIALFTISFQTIKAALANPVKSLRNE